MKIDYIFTGLIAIVIAMAAFFFGHSMGDKAGYKRAFEYYDPAIKRYEADVKERNDKIAELELDAQTYANEIKTLRQYIGDMATGILNDYVKEDSEKPQPVKNNVALGSSELNAYNKFLQSLKTKMEPK